jgi:hypothetical protein
VARKLLQSVLPDADLVAVVIVAVVAIATAVTGRVATAMAAIPARGGGGVLSVDGGINSRADGTDNGVHGRAPEAVKVLADYGSGSRG